MMNGRLQKRIITGVLLGACTLFLTGCSAHTTADTDVVLQINDQEVVKAEYQMVLNRYQAQVKSKYTTEEVNKEDFWTTEFENGNPLKEIMQLAESELLEKKVIAGMAQQYEIAAKTDYALIMAQLEEENSARAGAQATENVSYGLTSFDADSYYQYVYTGVETELTEKLKQEDETTEEALEAIYKENLKEYTYDVGVQMLVAEMTEEVGVKQSEKVAEALKESTDEEQLQEQFPDVNFYTLEMSDLDTQEGRSSGYALRWQVASEMKKDEVCTPFQIGENRMVMRCLSRTEHGQQTFEEIKDVLKSEVQTEYANEVIQKKIDGAVMSMNEKELEIAAIEALQGE